MQYPDRYCYIATLEYGEEGDLGVYFHDLPGCISGGDTVEDAIQNAKEALALHLYGMEEDGDPIPQPSQLRTLTFAPNEMPYMVDVYMKPFRERMHSKFIKKTLSIPNWLNTLAEEQNINFSATLQNALKEQLHIQN